MTSSLRGTPLRDFLDQFSGPVLLVSSEGRVVTANRKGLSLLNKTPENVDAKLGGDVFGCRYAALPGGCGKTVHCKACTIRNTIMDTLQSGKSNMRVPAYPDLHRITGDNRVRFLITTERVGQAVLLRIDDDATNEVKTHNQKLEVAAADLQ
jgi:hypothetical protein